MGNAAALFYSPDTEQQTLWRRVRPSDDQIAEQQKRWNDLRDYLIDDLKARAGIGVSSWLQGSYKFGTQVRPPRMGLEFDIDLGMYFRWKGVPGDGEHSAADLRTMVQDSLESYQSCAEGVLEILHPPKARCSRIRFEGDFHVDVPVYHLDAAEDRRTLALLDGDWEESDPKAIYLWFRDRFDDETRAKVRRQVQYLKNWAARTHGSDGPSSILITVLTALEYPKIDAAARSSDDDALQALAERLADRLDDSGRVSNPVDRSEDLNRMSEGQTTKFIVELRNLHAIGRRALRASDVATAAEAWAEAFAHFFPVPDEEEDGSGRRAIHGYPVPAPIAPDVSVEGTPKGSRHVFQGLNQIGPIPRDCDVVFRVANPDSFPNGTEFRWMVRNEGDEAEDVNDLGHPAGTGLIAREHSAYRGRHFMDVTAWHGGRLIGRRRVPVAIQGMPMPRRNGTRPSWTHLR